MRMGVLGVGLVLAYGMAFGAPAALAQPAIDGFFIAKTACPATPAIRQSGNPGDIRLDVGHAYRLYAQNKVPGTHYWIGVEGATPERRWVRIDCGTRVVAVDDVPVVGDPEVTATPDAPAPNEPQPVAAGGPSTRNLLAISWQPAFCEGQSRKTECRNQTADRFDATNFALHGLWPQPRGKEYCGVSAAVKATDKASDWADLPAPEVSASTRAALEKVMPGTQSMLDRHEWIRHGTCYGPAEAYFADSVRLVEAIAASPVSALFAGRIGQSVSLAEVRAAFDEGFGEGAGERIRIACPRDGSRRLIGEITIGLVGEIGPHADIGALILAASPTDGGCTEGIVDAVGLQ
ncbi:ribonuclease T2 family protein [Aureimonas glaciei]|uniref:Ribonuclease T(2) n=1 Tax=Aureimonas glaciei TaxID=1776957 RepID=A0A916XYC2_9HYPH|nr:ribonuclease [Aureimonas glaciei]GGD20985.1 ribonuclease T(2) [Aureimonas glaciei]